MSDVALKKGIDPELQDRYVETLNCQGCGAWLSIVFWRDENTCWQDGGTRADTNWRNLISRKGSGPRKGVRLEATHSYPFGRVEELDALLVNFPVTNGRYWGCIACKRAVVSEYHSYDGR